MDKSQLPPDQETIEDKLNRLKGLPDFQALVGDLAKRRDEGFRLMQGAKKRELHQIAGAMTQLDDLIAEWTAPGRQNTELRPTGLSGGAEGPCICPTLAETGETGLEGAS